MECSVRRASDNHSALPQWLRALVIEVRACGEELHHFEPVTGDVNEVIAAEPVFVKS
jgi:hypothetical protein